MNRNSKNRKNRKGMLMKQSDKPLTNEMVLHLLLELYAQKVLYAEQQAICMELLHLANFKGNISETNPAFDSEFKKVVSRMETACLTTNDTICELETMANVLHAGGMDYGK